MTKHTALMKIKPFLQVARHRGSDDIFFGVGPETEKLVNPSPAQVEFVQNLGTISAELTTEQKGWANDLRRKNLIEDEDLLASPEGIAFTKFDRQINYFRLFCPDDKGIAAQRKIRDSRVVIIGLGAGGTTLSRFLAAVGVGTIVGVDDDSICEQNLPTHTALGVASVGLQKTEAVRQMLSRDFPDTQFVPVEKRMNNVNDVRRIISGADFFCATFDRPRSVAARTANAAGLAEAVPFGSIGATDKGARVGPVVIAGQTPCYECFHIDEPEFILRSERAALMGATVTFLASIFVHEIVRVITGYAPSRLAGRLLYANTETWETKIHDPKRPNGWTCDCCGWKSF